MRMRERWKLLLSNICEKRQDGINGTVSNQEFDPTCNEKCPAALGMVDIVRWRYDSIQ